MQRCSFDSPDPEHTREMGAALGRCIGRDGLVLALIGPLGAGKTVFAKGIAEGLGVDPRIVSSPTFVIAQEYPLKHGPAGAARTPEEGGPTTLHHLDLYRLEDEDELESIGFFDMLAPGNVLAVEWADRFEGVLGRKVLTVELEGPSAPAPAAAPADKEADGERGAASPMRRASFMAEGEAAERVLRDFAARMSGAREIQSPETHEDARGGVRGGAGPEMRLFMMLCLCVLGLGTAMGRALDLGAGAVSSVQACEPTAAVGGEAGTGFLTVAEDALGTLRAEYVGCSLHPSAGGAARLGYEPATSGLSGMGRLLSGQRVDLASASSALLQRLPGVGPVRAESILAYRERGLLREARDLERVPGIGPKTRARLSRWIELRSNAPENKSG